MIRSGCGMPFFGKMEEFGAMGESSGDERMSVDFAVVPVAGRGTRLPPLTKSQPKEMLPVGRKPVVQYVVEELARCGIGRLLFLTDGPRQTASRGRESAGHAALSCFAPQPRACGISPASEKRGSDVRTAAALDGRRLGRAIPPSGRATGASRALLHDTRD
jgi:hypothetical protein